MIYIWIKIFLNINAVIFVSGYELILPKFGLEERLVNDFSTNFQTRLEIDWNATEKLLEAEIEKSYKFLKRYLK